MNRTLPRPRLVPVLLLGLLAGCADREAALPTEAAATWTGIGGPGAPLLQAGSQALPDRYIVVFKSELANPSAAAPQIVEQHAGTLHYSYEHALKGFAATLPRQAVEAVRRNPNVASVAEDGVVRASQTQQPNATCRIRACNATRCSAWGTLSSIVTTP